MRTKLPEKIEMARILYGALGSDSSYGPYGMFRVIGPCGATLLIMSSAGEWGSVPWEHVSVSIKNRNPNWDEMCWVKDQFWHDEETAIQFHPPRSEYVNNHRHCLHLWRPLRGEIPRPPAHAVGNKALGELT
jgi:hypothetical protein